MDPNKIILETRTEARKSKDGNAETCFLAIADSDGQASVRTLVLRDMIDNRYTLFINETSPKWQLLSQNSHYELLLWYPTQQKQFRINGSCHLLPHDEVSDKWQGRPDGSKYMDVLYQSHPQSSVIASRAELESRIHKIKIESVIKSMSPPMEVRGVELIANKIEVLDLNNTDRLHDRQVFTLENKQWTSEVLIP
ncbi:MAG: pyridoxamine 5'-phosphate oxidase family protein [Pseudomonadales bacterium]|nr:pyridoxamine 5'-phosphate oxidase family protein [Pseudomonadales bacterium]